MYWIFAILFSIAVLIPDIIRNDTDFLMEERAEEAAIFVLGSIAFLTFIINERKIALQKKEKEIAQKKMSQTVKDLVDSYSYIGEVNRKIDILMGVALGLTERSTLDRKKEKETYESIATAANFLLKANCSMIRFINLKTRRTEKEIKIPECANISVSNNNLIGMNENINIKKQNGLLIVSSPQIINNAKGYLIISDYDAQEEGKPKNTEILKLFASQAIFLYAYMLKEESNKNNSGIANN
ncbi:MAG TPA: hypothetical protein DCS28_00765 [Candidatus Moranbacteria bacterium]|nr:hypothetical protein [Candidatus Moranbacteria bacterium]HAT74560.1 hypothetical protein [Candidatus Moranbacteria bacterium]